MLIKAIIAEHYDNAIYDLSQEFNNIKLINSTEISNDRFISLHSNNLFSKNKDVLCFTYVEEKNNNILEDILLSNLTLDFIWVFNTLDKRSALYKFLQKKYKVESSGPLDSIQDRKKFIGKLLDKYKVENVSINSLVNTCSSSKLIIEQEIKNLSYIINNIKDSKLIQQNIYSNNNDIFKLIDSVISVNYQRFYEVFFRIESSIVQPVIHKLLLSKIVSMILLSKGLDKLSDTFWKNFCKEEIKNQSKSIGFNNLLDIYINIDNNLGNMYSNKPIYILLLSVMKYIESKSLGKIANGI